MRNRVRRLGLGLPLLLAGCAAALLPPGAPPEWPRLARTIASYYEDQAVERFGTCRLPTIEGFLKVETVARTPERLVLRVRYAWRDEAYGDEGDGLLDRCRGFATRTFVLDPESGRVRAMSGPTREQNGSSPDG